MKRRPRWRWGARPWLAAICLLGLSVPAHAGEGVYESLPLKKGEEQLLRTAGGFRAVAERRGRIYTHAELDELVDRIGSELAPPSTDPYIEYSFHILRDPHPGAFALPDGQVYVSIGMLAILENEAQLATVLAHEISHVAGHHLILTRRSERRKEVISEIVGAALTIAFDEFEQDLEFDDLKVTLGLLAVYAVVQSAMGYGPDLEEEADRQAVRRVAEIGYDVRESSRLFEVLGRFSRRDVAPRERGDIRTKWAASMVEHEEREVQMRRTSDEVGEGFDLDTLEAGAEGYPDLRWQVSLDSVHDYIRRDDPQSAFLLAERLVLERDASPEAHFALAEAYRALGAQSEVPAESAMIKKAGEKMAKERESSTREEMKARRLETPQGVTALESSLRNAIEEYARTLDLDSDLAEAHRGLGLAALELGSPREAARELLIYLRARPQARDRQAVLDHLRVIREELEPKGVEDATPQE